MEPSEHRLKVLEKIAEYERLGLFDQDAEDDPPSRPLKKGEVDYLQKKPTTRMKTAIANHVARKYFDGRIKRGELVINEIRGIENYLNLRDNGVIITANHFNPNDNYAIYKAIQPYLGKHCLYKVIREGNYTAFPGLFGFFFRNCNTLPLATDISVAREMMSAVNTLLTRGEKVLIYPEQALWWNYRKPRPLKPGAFLFAARANVPVLPMFITMEDTDTPDAEGFPIQAYTIHILPPIYPDNRLSSREMQKKMCEENYAAWKNVYEEFYHIPLTYTTEESEGSSCST